MRIRSRTACLVAVAAVVGAGTSSASAATITFDVPFAGDVMNDCTGELVAVAGTEHFKATDNTSLTDTKSQLEMNLTGASGIGLVSGARYVMNNQTSTMDHQEFDPLGDAQLTMETSTIFNRQGETAGLMAGDDSRLHVLAHLTITDGVTKSVKNDLRFDCS